MAVKIPKINFHLTRDNTPTSNRRHMSRMADDVDNAFSDLVNQLLSTPLMAHITGVSTGTVSIPTDSATVVSWQAASNDTDGMWALTPNPTRLTARIKAFYLIRTNLDVSVAGSGTFVVSLYANGVFAERENHFIQIAAQSVQNEWFVALNVNDYLELYVTRPAGAATSITGTFSAALLGTY